MTIRTFFVVLIFLAWGPAPAHAEKEDSQNQAKAKTHALPEEQTPLEKWREAEEKIAAKIPAQERHIYAVIREKHGILRAIEIVERDIGAAVASCSEKNPDNTDLKQGMEARFEDWKAAVRPMLETATRLLDTEMKEQKALKLQELKKLLALNDAAFSYQESKIVKEPVATQAACQKLLRSMDRTEDDLIRLLQETLLPENVIRSRSKR